MKCRAIIVAALVGVLLIACRQADDVRRTPTPRIIQPPTPTPFPSTTLTVTPQAISAAEATQRCTAPCAATPVGTAPHVVPTSSPVPSLTSTVPVPATVTPQTTATPMGARVTIVALNKGGEWVDLRNVGDALQALDGWVLRSEKGSQDCPLSGSLAAGQTLRVWAMAEDAGQGGYNCQFDTEIWNNSESDPAVLLNAAGVEVARHE